jgi:hypothetical protein
VVAYSTGTVTITNGTAGSMSLSFWGIPNYKYVIQRSPDFSAWTDVITNTAATNRLLQYSEMPPWNPTLYRVRTE